MSPDLFLGRAHIPRISEGQSPTSEYQKKKKKRRRREKSLSLLFERNYALYTWIIGRFFMSSMEAAEVRELNKIVSSY